MRSARPQLLSRRGPHSAHDYYGMDSSSSRALSVPPSQLEGPFHQQQAFQSSWCKSCQTNYLKSVMNDHFSMVIKLCQLSLITGAPSGLICTFMQYWHFYILRCSVPSLFLAYWFEPQEYRHFFLHFKHCFLIISNQTH